MSETNDLVYFIWRGANADGRGDQFAYSAETGGGPYRDEAMALQQGRISADVDGRPALVLGVPVQFLQVVAVPGAPVVAPAVAPEPLTDGQLLDLEFYVKDRVLYCQADRCPCATWDNDLPIRSTRLTLRQLAETILRHRAEHTA